MRATITGDPIDPARLLAEVSNHANGAATLFVGTVRDIADGRPVHGLDYQAYEVMALAELQEIVAEAAGQFGTRDLVVEHRIGSLQLGDVAVAIAAAHPHRAPTFDAARYVIEQIKIRVPIWKLEQYADGDREWVDPTAARAGMPSL